MVRFTISALVVLLAVCVASFGCTKKQTQSTATTQSPTSQSSTFASTQNPAIEPIAWGYDQSPVPAIDGKPVEMLGSFTFNQGATSYGQESRGACREAANKLDGKSSYRLAVIGFADGITENGNAQSLGMKRAEAARSLLSSFGVSAEHVQVASFGATYSKAKDYEKIAQSRERKVEIWLLQ